MEGTKAILLRRGDLLQVIVETASITMADSSSNPPEASTDPAESGGPVEPGDGNESSNGHGAFHGEMTSIRVVVIISFFLSLL